MSQEQEKTEARYIYLEIEQAMKKKRSIKTALPLIVDIMINGGRSFSPSDYRRFTHQIDSHKWQGIIYQNRNTMMGCIFSYFGNKVHVVKSYPKIKYAEASRVLNQEVHVENKWDGTNLGVWLMPDGKTVMAKTRMVEWWGGQGYKGMRWDLLFNRAMGKSLPDLMNLLKEDYLVFGELVGTENPGEFVRYSFPIAFKGFDIVDRRTQSFLPLKEKMNLLLSHGIDYVGLHWEGALTMKEVERIEFEIKDLVKEDGYEGMVAKWYDPISKDIFMCKLKCAEIKEKAWSLSPRAGVPRAIIAKAVRKAFENNIKDMDSLVAFVKDELAEEVEPELIEKSSDDIKQMVYKLSEPIKGAELIQNYLKELEAQGIPVTLENKGKVMSMLATRFFGQSPSFLYSAFLIYCTKNEGKLHD